MFWHCELKIFFVRNLLSDIYLQRIFIGRPRTSAPVRHNACIERNANLGRKMSGFPISFAGPRASDVRLLDGYCPWPSGSANAEFGTSEAPFFCAAEFAAAINKGSAPLIAASGVQCLRSFARLYSNSDRFARYSLGIIRWSRHVAHCAPIRRHHPPSLMANSGPRDFSLGQIASPPHISRPAWQVGVMPPPFFLARSRPSGPDCVRASHTAQKEK